MQEAFVQQIVFYRATYCAPEGGGEGGRGSRASCKQLRLAGSISRSRSCCVGLCGWQHKVDCGVVTAELPTAVQLITVTTVCSGPYADCCQHCRRRRHRRRRCHHHHHHHFYRHYHHHTVVIVIIITIIVILPSPPHHCYRHNHNHFYRR